MSFTESARIAERHPDLAAAAQRISAQLQKMRTAETIRPDDLASFLELDPNQVRAVLAELAATGFLRVEAMVECVHCGVAALRTDYDEAFEEDGEYRCTCCDRPLGSRTIQAVTTYRRGEKWPEISGGAETSELEVVPVPLAMPVQGPHSSEGATEVAAQSFCRLIAHSGARELSSRGEYDKLLGERGKYDMFIDGISKFAYRRKGKGARMLRSKLTAAEYEIIREYIETKKPMRPLAAAVCQDSTRTTATKLFERARGKVDIKIGRYQFRAFQTHRSTDRSAKAFEFVPPRGFSYCLIVLSQ